MLKPDRKNGMLISEKSNSELLIKISAILLSIFILLYYYYDELNWWNWIISLFIIWAFTEIILQLTIRQIFEKMHDSPLKKKYYFRSGISVGLEKYSKNEKDEMDRLQKEMPLLFITTDKDQKEQFYYRFENRTWISEEKIDMETVKKEINSYLKMKNI
tara:strand:- start:136 stop:612 length:477 start_codon:yes stop_codon:yes gene_type:complete